MTVPYRLTEAEELLYDVFNDQGIGDWVTDRYGRLRHVDEVVTELVKMIRHQLADEAEEVDAAERLENLRAALNELTGKTISINRVRRILDGDE